MKIKSSLYHRRKRPKDLCCQQKGGGGGGSMSRGGVSIDSIWDRYVRLKVGVGVGMSSGCVCVLMLIREVMHLYDRYDDETIELLESVKMV